VKIAILTGGGDCAGLNAAVRAVVVNATRNHDSEVWGVQGGLYGLHEGQFEKLESNFWYKEGFVLERGGTLLKTRVKRLPPEGVEREKFAVECEKVLRSQGFDALVIVGGDITLGMASIISKQNFPVIAIPKTIDNDVLDTESIGFNTALQVGVNAMDRVRTTAMSHDRVIIVEVMGRDAGFLPLSVAIAGGADIALIPEIPYQIEDLIEAIQERKRRDGFVTIVISEAAFPEGVQKNKVGVMGNQRYRGAAHILEENLCDQVHSVRSVILGHVQRGGAPLAFDRIIASRMGVAAVNALKAGKSDIIIGWDGSALTEIPLNKIQSRSLNVESNLVQTAIGLDIFLGKDLKKS